MRQKYRKHQKQGQELHQKLAPLGKRETTETATGYSATRGLVQRGTEEAIRGDWAY